MKSCPFCGEDDIATHLRDGWFYVSCNNCGSSTYQLCDNKREAVEIWQTRPLEDALLARAHRAERMVERLIEAGNLATEFESYSDRINSLYNWRDLVAEWRKEQG